MKRLWIPLCIILGFFMLAYSLYFWGGVASTAEVGTIVSERASTFSFIAWSYISAGKGIVDLLGWQDSASQFAHASVGDSFAAMQQNPLLALHTLFESLPAYSLVCYYGGPLLILIGAFAQAQKPKSFKTFGSK